jgi:hypothetical protein
VKHVAESETVLVAVLHTVLDQLEQGLHVLPDEKYALIRSVGKGNSPFARTS